MKYSFITSIIFTGFFCYIQPMRRVFLFTQSNHSYNHINRLIYLSIRSYRQSSNNFTKEQQKDYAQQQIKFIQEKQSPIKNVMPLSNNSFYCGNANNEWCVISGAQSQPNKR